MVVTERVLELVRVEAVVGKFRVVPREAAVIWEEKSMAFKGSKPGKGDGGEKGKDQASIMEMYREIADTQQACIHALAAALMATEEEDEDEDEEEGEDEDEEKESS